jgi:hypothetical protein
VRRALRAFRHMAAGKFLFIYDARFQH